MNSSTDSLNHQNLGSMLSQLNVPLSVSEVHGLGCALLCAQPSASAKTRWFTELLDAASVSADQVATKASQLKSLDEWFAQTLTALHDSDLDFSPVVPDDEVPVAERVRALGDFCAGFTYGIGLSMTQRAHRPLPDDTREIIEDFQAIDAADQMDDEGESLSIDKQESVYIELLEYVRVGVLLVLEELRPISHVQQDKLS